MLKQPSAYLPVATSFAALAMVLVEIAEVGRLHHHYEHRAA
jgi:hypothetical protein